MVTFLVFAVSISAYTAFEMASFAIISGTSCKSPHALWKSPGVRRESRGNCKHLVLKY